MRNIVYYVTDHGKGHATRTVAIIRELKSHNVNIIIRNSNQQKFFHSSLPDIMLISGITDKGPIIKKDGISIDHKRTYFELKKWFKEINKIVVLEDKKISKYNLDLIISDISPMPFLVAQQLKIPSIAISNFSWYDVLDDITKEQKQFLREAYNQANYTIQLPLGTKMEHFKKRHKIGFVCRKPTLTKDEIRKKLGINKKNYCIFIDLGKTNNRIELNVNENIKIITTGTSLRAKNCLRLPEWTEGQNLVSASDLVICKLGYGMISECLTNGIPFRYLSSGNHLEQKAMEKCLKKLGNFNKITVEQLERLEINQKLMDDLTIPKKEKNDTKSAVNHILELLK